MRSVLRHPAPWLLIAILLAVLPALSTFTRLALTTDQGSLPGILQQLVALALLAGVLWGRGLAARADWLLARAVGLRRLWAEALLMATPACLFALAALAMPLLSGALPGEALPEMAWRSLTGLTHLVAIALVLGSGGGGSIGNQVRRSWWALPVVGWLVPAWLSGSGRLGSHLSRWTDFRLSMAPFELGPFGSPVITAYLPIIGWSLAAILLATAPHTLHALRRPR